MSTQTTLAALAERIHELASGDIYADASECAETIEALQNATYCLKEAVDAHELTQPSQPVEPVKLATLDPLFEVTLEETVIYTMRVQASTFEGAKELAREMWAQSENPTADFQNAGDGVDVWSCEDITPRCDKCGTRYYQGVVISGYVNAQLIGGKWEYGGFHAEGGLDYQCTFCGEELDAADVHPAPPPPADVLRTGAVS